MKKYLLVLSLLLCANLYGQKKVKSKTIKKQIAKTEVVAEPIKKEDIKVEDPQKNVYQQTTIIDETVKVETKKIENIDCKYFQNYKNEKETYKVTKLSLVYLRNYSGTNERIYFSVAKKNEIPNLNIDLIYKSNNLEYGNNLCFGQNSKLIFSLKGGTTVTLLHIENEDCYKTQINGIRDISRNISGSFRFLQGNIEALRNTTLESMQIIYENGEQQYVFQSNVFSETENSYYEPQTYFQKNINCIDN